MRRSYGTADHPRARARRRRLDRRGTTSLEFALIAMPLFMLILGGVELARYAATITSLRAVVDDATRAATLTGYANMIADRAPCTGLGTGTSLHTVAVNTTMLNPSKLTLTVSSCTVAGAITTVNMEARYTHTFLFALLTPANGTFVETATAAFN